MIVFFFCLNDKEASYISKEASRTGIQHRVQQQTCQKTPQSRRKKGERRIEERIEENGRKKAEEAVGRRPGSVDVAITAD